MSGDIHKLVKFKEEPACEHTKTPASIGKI